jgi:hypothetical protein
MTIGRMYNCTMNKTPRARILGASVIAAASLAATTGPAGATSAGNPQSPNACMGWIVSWGDHPEFSPAFFAQWDGESVQTVMKWTLDFCKTVTP